MTATRRATVAPEQSGDVGIVDVMPMHVVVHGTK